MRVGVTLAVVGAIVGEWAGAERGLGVLINLARGSPLRHPVDVRHAADHRAGRDRALPRRRAHRAPARRRSLNLTSSPEVPVSLLASASSCRSPRRPPARLRARPRRPPGRRRPARPVPRRPAAVRASRARRPVALDRRPRLHPERPVRPVLPGRPGGLLRRRRARRHVPERDRPRPHHARRPGRARHRHRRRHQRDPGRQPGHPDQVRRDDLRPVPVDRVRKARPGSTTRGGPQGQEAGHPRPLRLVVDHAPGAARSRPI